MLFSKALFIHLKLTAMKKHLLLIAGAVFLFAQMSGQEPTFLKGDKVLNVGLGLGSTLYSGTYYKSQIPPISASLEIGVADEIIDKGVIGVGPYFGYSGYKYEYMTSKWKYTTMILGAKGNFHYPLVEKLDTYTGLLLGYNIVTSKWTGSGVEDDYSASSSGLAWSWFIGGRYWFKETLGAMLELGYGISYLNIGIAAKF